MLTNRRRKIQNVKVTDVEKRRYPSKHYVYIIQVSWDDKSETVIFRRYSKFFDFQIALLETFPREGGLRDPSERIIPFLPGKILFGRSHVREVAIKRLKPIDEYCYSLIQLPALISNSELVLDFFESKPEDLQPSTDELARKKKNDDQVLSRDVVKRTRSFDISEISGPITLEQYCVIADFTRSQPKELTVSVGQQVEVIEKHENGWWFVNDDEGERGWVPGIYLEKRDGKSENLVTKQAELGHGEKYITSSQFAGGSEDEISFGTGVLVEVLQKNLEGWWYISYQGKEGWAPASYLEKPADAVLRQNSKRNLFNIKKNSLENRRSLPGDASEARIIPSVSNRSSAIGKTRHDMKLVKRNSNPSLQKPLSEVKNSISKPIPIHVRPPPKRSTLRRDSVKPPKPPPLPPAPKSDSEHVYEYFTNASFTANIPHSISFDQNEKVKVLEKSPNDWWYIELDGNEGWAPSSYIQRVYKSEHSNKPADVVKQTKSPERPKPPCSSNKPVKPSKLDNIHTAGDGPSLLKSKPTNEYQKSETKFNHSKPILPKTTKPTQTISNDTNNAVSKNHRNNNNLRPAPAKPVSKPLPLGNRPKLKSSSAFVQESQVNKKPVASTQQLRPVATNKNFVKKQSFSDDNSAKVDFRSVLKPASSGGGKKHNELSNNFRPTVPGKPTVPIKPSNKTAVSKSTSASATKPTAAIKKGSSQPDPPHKSCKPVLRRFQTQNIFNNQNGNNNSNNAISGTDTIVNTISVEQSPVNALLCKPRGSPDGQVDKIDFKDEVSINFNETPSVVKSRLDSSNYIAVADFAPENQSELGFSYGSVATLLEISDNNWWYVAIDGNKGWVPASYFKQQPSVKESSNLIESLNDFRQILEVSEANDDPLYSEIYENSEGHNTDAGLFRVILPYTSEEKSTISAGVGDLVRALEHTTTGWCFVQVVQSKTKFVNQEGWLPSDHLQKQ